METTQTRKHTAIDHKALLGLVPEPAGLVWTGRLSGAMHRWKLAVLPAAHAEQKAHDIALLLAPQLFQVLDRKSVV